MKIGVLELGEYQFIKDLMQRFGGTEIEFISVAEQRLPMAEKYKVILDRLSFQDPYLRQVMMLASLNGAYVINNPFASSMNNKVMHQKLIETLGVKQPKTMVLPRVNEEWDLGGSVKEPNWDEVKKEISFPCIIKPFDGFAWDDVYTAATFRELQNLYNSMKYRCILLLQEKIEYTDYFRVFCINKRDVLITKWNPKPFGLGEYMHPDQKQMETIGKKICDATIKLNKMIDFDVNAVEWCVDDDGELYIIDAMNEVPDIVKNSMPEDFYWWIVEKFCQCIREKFSSNEKNRRFFDQ